MLADAPEMVSLVTGLPPEQFDDAQELKRNRAARSIENGPHPRLDASDLDNQ